MNIMIIGVGYHANRIYLPIIGHFEKTLNVKLKIAIDLITEEIKVKQFLRTNNFNDVFFQGVTQSNENISKEATQKLKNLIKKHQIQSVIISCTAIHHKKYILFAIENNLNILVDKPITITENASISLKNAKSIWSDYCEIKHKYILALTKNPNLIFSCQAQRRYHPAIDLIQEKINETYELTKYAPNSIFCHYSDGQWRMPEELIKEDYHGFNQGIGMLSHSGYHFFDTSLLYLKKIINQIDSFEVFTNAIKPHDFIYHFPVENYPNIFHDYSNKYKENNQVLMKKSNQQGEMDCHVNIAVKSNHFTRCNIGLTLLHNGFSKRSWLISRDDLYKNNGRVRHETHVINQGPFQTIYYSSLQSEQNNEPDFFDDQFIDGKHHSEVIIFRNTKMLGKKENTVSKYSFSHANLGIVQGHQEYARQLCIEEFLLAVLKQACNTQMKSTFFSHELSVLTLSMAHRSIVQRIKHKNPVINESLNIEK